MSLTLTALDGRVELREHLGSGGMGEVHAAWDRGLARAVAVKFVRGSGPADAERLLLEARLQARVEHPHVVRVFEVGTLGGRPCIVFQLVPGKTLQELAGTLSVADRADLVRQAATGVHAAHLQGLVHRDVKPGNILVEEGEAGRRTALVTDFGLAHAEEGGLTRSGVLPGTLDFMAPEQLAGGGPVDFRSDVYALGATLYAVLSGRPPFRIPSARPDPEEQVKLLRRILDDEAPALRSVSPELPRDLSVIASKAMEKEPGARYPSAEAFADDLHRFQRGEPIRARPPTVTDRMLKWSRRNRAASRSIAAAVAILLAAGAFALWQSRQAGRDALEAARLGALAASLESRMRMEYLSPPHDLRPALAEVKREVEALRPLADRRGGGPASYALGKGLELLGELDAARLAYQHAWDLGFRTPQAAEGLGGALGRVFERERQRARRTLAPEARDRRLAELQASILEPARRILQSADRRGARGAWLDAGLAEAEGEVERARQRARQALQADAGLYEALLLEGSASVQEGVDRMDDGMLPEAEAALARALGPLEEALRIGRSDTRVLVALARAEQWRAEVAYRRGDDPAAAAGRALAWTERGLALDPDGGETFLVRGMVRTAQGKRAGMTGGPEARERLSQAVEELRRARRLQPSSAEVLSRLVGAWYDLASFERRTGKPSDAETAEGVRIYEEALAVAPGDASIRHNGLLVLLERARGLSLAGKAEPRDYQAAIQAGEAALALQPRARGVVLDGLTSAQIDLAREQWNSGLDPRPALTRGLELAEELVRTSPTMSALTRSLWARGTAAHVYLALGQDFAGLSAGTLELAGKARALKPEHPYLKLLQGENSLVEAQRRLAADQDPAAALAEAGRWIVPASKALGSQVNVRHDLAKLELVRARSELRAGADPTASLDRAEAATRRILATDAESLEALARLMEIAIERSLRARGQGRSGEAEARAGLEAAVLAMKSEDKQADVWKLQAWLQALAGDRAAARASLDRAYALQPLVKGGREARAAEALLAAGAR